MKQFEFHLSISPERYMDYYRGVVKQVVAQCDDGANIQFPASLLTKFITAAGIHGRFVLTCDDDNKGADLRRWKS